MDHLLDLQCINQCWTCGQSLFSQMHDSDHNHEYITTLPVIFDSVYQIRVGKIVYLTARRLRGKKEIKNVGKHDILLFNLLSRLDFSRVTGKFL